MQNIYFSTRERHGNRQGILSIYNVADRTRSKTGQALVDTRLASTARSDGTFSSCICSYIYFIITVSAYLFCSP